VSEVELRQNDLECEHLLMVHCYKGEMVSSDFVRGIELSREERQWVNVAIAAAQEAGNLLQRHFGEGQQIRYKGAKDLVTAMDLQSQQAILARLKTHFPEHAILAEEGITEENPDVPRWIIDPLDGTTNYAHGFPFFAVSLGLEHRGHIVVGVVYVPVLTELFVAVRGKGAYLNGKKLTVSTVPVVQESLLATGFTGLFLYPGSSIFADFAAFSLQAQGVRRAGSAAIDLCYVAAGRLEGFWEKGLKPWDLAAASLAIEEAGGRISDFQGTPFQVMQKETLASNGFIHEEMIQILANSGKELSASDAV
jgi:myo-inositol-1(or 4)-monophosphatase